MRIDSPKNRKHFFAAASLVVGAAALLIAPWDRIPASRLAAAPRGPAAAADADAHQNLRRAFARLPLRFEENRGQTDRRVQFLARGRRSTLYLTSTEAVLELAAARDAGDLGAQSRTRCFTIRCTRELMRASGDSSGRSILRLRWVGGNSEANASGLDPVASTSNYFGGNDPRRWHTNIRNYARVRYSQTYPGIDLIYYGGEQGLEFDFVVAPGADPEAIRFDIEGADSLAIDSQGRLAITPAAAGGPPRTEQEVRLLAPVIYQQEGDARRSVAGKYKLLARNRVGVELGPYNRALPLVVDPVLSYSSYLGGTGYDQVSAIAVDQSGRAYVAGITTSTNFPTAAPFRSSGVGGQDAFVAALSADGSQLIYSTYLGGSADDVAVGIAVDSGGNAVVAGSTVSTDFPTASPFQSTLRGTNTIDTFVTKLNASGSALLFSTYLGGSGDDGASALAVDVNGAVYVAGQTTSTNFPLQAAVVSGRQSTFDGYVTKLSPAGNSLIFSTYLGGNQDDGAQGVAADTAGNAFITGYTRSSNFPRVNFIQGAIGGGNCTDGVVVFPCADAFVTKIAAAGSQISYSTYLGGSAEDSGQAIAVDSAGNAYVTGYTGSSNFPTVMPIQSALAGEVDVFVTKVNANGSALSYSTYLGGLLSEFGNGIGVDANGSAVVVGSTGSSAFPAVNAIQQWRGSDAFAAKLNPAGTALVYSTFLGGGANDIALAVAVDAAGSAYIGGATVSADFPLQQPVQGALGGGSCISGSFVVPCPDGFISKLTVNPGLFTGGIVNGASFTPGGPLAPGSIASAFGADITGNTGAAGSIPLPTDLSGVSLRLNGILAPLFYTSGTQENFQVPWELAGQSQATAVLTVDGISLPPITVNLAPTAPGIFTTNSQGFGQGAILIAGTAILAAPTDVFPGSRPASRGETISIYCTGLGNVANRPPTGSAVPGGNATVLAPVTVTIGGVSAQVTFAGLAPGYVGLYQVNAVVPGNIGVGNAVPVVLSANGVISNTTTIAVQ